MTTRPASTAIGASRSSALSRFPSSKVFLRRVRDQVIPRLSASDPAVVKTSRLVVEPLELAKTWDRTVLEYPEPVKAIPCPAP
jgi:hypothetical protein